MSTAPATGDMFNVTHIAPFEDEGVPAGVVSIDSAQQIEIISAEEKFADEMELAAEMINSSDEFLLRVSPPPDASPRATFKRGVARDAPDAREAVLEVLREEYGFELTPAA